MKHLRATGIVCAAGLITSLLLARAHPFGDAGLHAITPSQTPIAENAAVPVDVRTLLVTKCADCHSAETRLPLYDRVAIRLAPASWLIERDIVQGRKAMNLDAWGSYSADKQQTFAAKMVKETKSHEMPLLQYRIIHRYARITDADLRLLSQWSESLQDIEPEAESVPAPAVKSAAARSKSTATVSASSTEQAAPAIVHTQSSDVAVNALAAPPLPEQDGPGDPVRGLDVFQRRCTGCHAMNTNRDGPMLQGVYGRAAATAPGFEYSTALKQSHISWDDGSLEQWLTDPDTLVPGNDMDFHVAKPQERKDIIAYLKQSSGK
ncbi:MAG TPA: heme-binding domain-containing protein [Acidobacteriaceae bacterium]|nr:heme-binding domain-containing protein [Acidobacteriaceae bacterium]